LNNYSGVAEDKKMEKDLRNAMLFFIKELVNLKQREKLLIYVDKGSDLDLAKFLSESAKTIGAYPELFELNSNLKLADMSRELIERNERGAFDVICELSEQYFYHTPAWQRALQRGSRIYSLAGLNTDAFIRCIGKVNHNSMLKFGKVLKTNLKKAKSIKIYTKKGTKITFKMDNNFISRFLPGLENNIALRIISRLTRKRRSYITFGSSKQIKKGQSAFMGGQLAFRGIPETIDGTAVIDGYLWPPYEIGLLDVPIILKIQNGNVIKINGCPSKSKLLEKWIGRNPKEVEHFCIGFNPGADLSGKILEAERVFGYISIGIGKYPFHTDGIMKNPSILLDDRTIEQDGSFIQEELSIIERELLKDIPK
jgi:leucyl aminopeptidase (aminopeptidase T)